MEHIKNIMNVCILIDGISNSGGTDRVATTLANSLSNSGIKTTIFTMNDGDSYYELCSKVEVKSLKKESRIMKIIEFGNYCKKKTIDIVIVISMGRLSCEAIPLLKMLRIGSKVICSDHVAIESFGAVIRSLKKIAYLLSDKIAVLTEHDKNYLERKMGIKEKVMVIRNISPYSDIEYNYTLKKNIVLSVGRLTEQKNQVDLLSVWKDIDKKDWSLLIIGDGENKKQLIDFINKEKIEKVEILSATKDIDKYYSSSKIFALTSKYEGLPMVLIEAKSFGVACISYNCPTGPKEIISDDGYLIDLYDKPKFQKDLQYLINNEKVVNELCDKAYCNSKKFSRDEILERWFDIMGVK